MWDEEIDHYADLFVACGYRETGLTFEAFLRCPWDAVRSIRPGSEARRWARDRGLTVTEFAKAIGGGVMEAPDMEDRRREGIAEHERFDREVRRSGAWNRPGEALDRRPGRSLTTDGRGEPTWAI